MRHYKFENGTFIEDPAAIMPGIQWDDLFGNSFRAIVSSLDFSTLRYNQELPYGYTYQILIEGMPDWLTISAKGLSINRQDHYIDIATQTLVPLATVGTMDEFGVVTFNPGYEYELDYFIDVYKGTQSTTYNFWEYLVRQVAIAENIDFDTWNV